MTTFRRRLVIASSWGLNALIPLTILSFLSLVALLFAMWVSPPSNLFIVDAHTSRLEFKFAHNNRTEIQLRGVSILTENTWVTADTDDIETETAHCYTGTLTPFKDTKLLLKVVEGRQFLQLSPQVPDADATGEDIRSNPVGKLSFTDKSYVLKSSRDTKIENAKVPKQQNSLLLNQSNAAGFLAVNGRTEIAPDPLCFEDGKTKASFATRSSPISIEGPGHMGADFDLADEIKPSNRSEVLEYLTGDIAVVARRNICRERLWGGEDLTLIERLTFAKRAAACPEIVPQQSGPLPLPSNSSVVGQDPENDTFIGIMIGQAYFDEGLYKANVSISAPKLAIFRSAGSDDTKSLIPIYLGPSLLNRLQVEPTLVLAFSLFVGLVSLIIAILQVEVHEQPTKKPTRKSLFGNRHLRKRTRGAAKRTTRKG